MKNELRNAYFAGLIDGEGCVMMKSAGSGQRRRPFVKVNMTCQKTVEAIKEAFGLGCISYKPPPKNQPTWKPQWEWTVTSKSAILVLEAVLPYLITKRAAAEEVYAQRFIKKEKRLSK